MEVKHGSEFYQIHSLRVYGPGKVNCDLDGSIKAISFGGYDRPMISGQKCRREIRKSIPDESRSTQTRELRARAQQRLLQASMSPAKAAEWAESIVDAFLGHDVKKKDDKKAKDAIKKAKNLAEGKEEKEKEEKNKDETTRVTLYELDWLDCTADAVAEGKIKNVTDLDITKAYGGYAEDIALFGRMKPTSITGAVSMGASYGVFAAKPQSQCFTVEDELLGFAKTKVAHLGMQPISADLHYNNALINFRLLVELCGKDRARAVKVLKDFVRYYAINGASSNSNGSSHSKNFVSFMLIEKLDGGCSGADAAFLAPVASLEEARDRILNARIARDVNMLCMPKVSPSASIFVNSSCVATGALSDLTDFIK